MAPTNTTRPATSRTGEHVDPDDLMCPGCGEQVRPEPPGYWLVTWGLPAAGFSHWDASALCLERATGHPAEPVEVEQAGQR
jgi:protein-disulfide isomerase